MSKNPKIIYFAQHGLAVDKNENPERPLSETGIQQTGSVADRLSISSIPVSKIFHSGKQRAAQTAEIFASALAVSTVSITNHLSPNDDVTLLANNLNENNALYVGHLPHLEKLVAYLVTGNKNGNIIKFKNSAVACLEKNDKNYQLKWYLTPDELLKTHF
ncbi:MAG: phosphohistidine phosphatase SixA [Gammaproteobacteria bacterium]|nr:phosphohistidine phosphatase SixA [Gammaproteobacteria bacterium]